MPNHVYHQISIGSEITKEREEILKKIEKAGGLCRYYKPMPKDLDGTTSPQRIGDTITKEKSEELIEKYGHDNWYDWCNDENNWNTKWGCYDLEIDDEVVRFTTAWSPISELIVKMMAQDFPDMFWTFEEEQGWGAEISLEGGDIIDVKEYDVPHFTEEVEVDTGKFTTTLTKLTEEHPNYTDYGLGWYVDWSQEFAGKTLEDAKKYLQDSSSPKDIVGEVEKEKIEACKNSLKKKGWFVDHLWNTDDVMKNYKCDESEAQNVLYSVFDSEWLIQQIFEMIDEQCKAKGIERK